MPLRKFSGKTPSLAESVFIDETAVIVGDVTIGEHSSVWPLAVIRGDVGPVVIGQRTNIQDGCILHGTPAGPTSRHGEFVTIGNAVTVGHGAVLHGCTVGSHCLIGMRTVVMDAAVLADETVVGANSFVPSGMRLESGYVWVGNPVRKMRPLTDDERALLRESARHYVELKDIYLTEAASVR
jgi:carbonic anhydrase/acetyltransferase-like protein (isoleucine patch superfamily)